MFPEHIPAFDCLDIPSERHKGRRYIDYAVALILEDPNKLHNVTKGLYSEIAEHFGTTPGRVEHGMRNVCHAAWNNSSELLKEWAVYPLNERPCVTRLLSILVFHIKQDDAEFQALLCQIRR